MASEKCLSGNGDAVRIDDDGDDGDDDDFDDDDDDDDDDS
jgi:hypothetical protein